MCGYHPGGKDNYEADRVAAREVLAAMPGILPTVQANRAYLRRAVQFLAGEAGIRQFLDIGTGLPTASNTHEVAQQIAPQSRIVYVDNDRCKSGCARAAMVLLMTIMDVLRAAETLMPDAGSSVDL
jgi:hypothetical protein